MGAPAPLALTRKFLLARPPTVEELEQHLERVESFEVDTTYLRSTEKAARGGKGGKGGVSEKHRVRRRQQGTNTSFQHQMWVTEVQVAAPKVQPERPHVDIPADSAVSLA